MPSDSELFLTVRQRLYTAVVGDILDSMGRLVHFLPPRICPITPEMVVVGRARPVIVEDGPGTARDPFGRLLEALDALREGDVYLTNGGVTEYALWGELLATRATHLKAAGAVMNGYHRDTNGILATDFPVFSWGAWAKDIKYRGRVVDYNVPTVIGGVPVAPGDVVFGDRDGVLVVPQDLAGEVFSRALEAVSGENMVREGFRRGMAAVEAWKKYGVM